jgi:D-isomer specific 2-hydroxyacid dehydrogenase, NAD binding domain
VIFDVRLPSGVTREDPFRASPVEQDEEGVWCAVLGLRPGMSANGEAGLRLAQPRRATELAQVAGPDELPGPLAVADAVICCAMFNETNAGMFGMAVFSAMKPGALFINVARAGSSTRPRCFRA